MRGPLHWSTLRHMAESPAHCKHYMDHGLETTPAMRFGSLVHAMTLNVAPRSFVVFEKPRRGNAWKDFKEQHAGLEIVTAEEWKRASDCADAVKADPVAGPLIREGLREVPLEWEIAGRDCAGTPDVTGAALVDLKVTPMANPNRFGWHARKMGWNAQLDWYVNGVEASGDAVEAVYIVAVTPKPPHCVVVYGLTETTLELGRKTWTLYFERFRNCEESNCWPGYSQSVVTLDLEDDGPLELVIDGEEIAV